MGATAETERLQPSVATDAVTAAWTTAGRADVITDAVHQLTFADDRHHSPPSRPSRTSLLESERRASAKPRPIEDFTTTRGGTSV